MEHTKVLSFFYDQMKILDSKLKIDHSLILMFAQKSFDIENLKEIENFDNYKPVRNDTQKVMDNLLIFEKKSAWAQSKRIRNVEYFYDSYGNIYMSNDHGWISIELLEQKIEKNKKEIIMRSFSFTKGSVSLNNQKYQFNELGSEWQNGIESAVLSFLEMNRNPEKFINERCIDREEMEPSEN